MARPAHFEGTESLAQHLTWATKERKPLLAEEIIAERCLVAFEKERPRLRTPVFAYALMPDHVHLIIGPGVWPPGTVVQWLKLASTYWLKQEGLTHESPWARGYWDRAIRDPSQLLTAIRYVHANPAKAGLVDNLDDYNFSSYREYHGLARSILKIVPAPLI